MTDEDRIEELVNDIETSLVGKSTKSIVIAMGVILAHAAEIIRLPGISDPSQERRMKIDHVLYIIRAVMEGETKLFNDLDDKRVN